MTDSDPLEILQAALGAFASALTSKFSQPLRFNPEDQLKSPIESLMKEAGAALGLPVEAVTEVQEKEIQGRPDVGVLTHGLLAGHIELKAPGTGSNTARFRGTNRKQWKRFSDLPNLIYTDGNEWALYRDGARVGRIVRLVGDVTADGAEAVSEANARSLLDMLREFLGWEPIVPRSPRALAEMLAPICRLLRQDVLDALDDEDSSLSSLAEDWRRYLFPDADDAQFADAYAQTLSYAMLLARFSGDGEEGTGLSVEGAAQAIKTGHRLLSDTLRILSEGREEIEVPVGLLERIIGAIDVAVLTRRSGGDPWLYFYEDFLAAYDPQMRNDRGVYYTPIPVVQAQVRLVARLLEQDFDAEGSFADPAVTTLDPTAGTGTYLLTAVEHALDSIEGARGKGMRRSAATTAARNVHGFELLVGPYAVAHLRLTQQILAEGGQVGDDGVHVYLTDTLGSPYALRNRMACDGGATGRWIDSHGTRVSVSRNGQRTTVGDG